MDMTIGGRNPWAGMIIYRVYKDGYGVDFPTGAKYVCFDGQYLVGEFSYRSTAENAFVKGIRVEGGVKLKDYLGIDEDLRQ